MLGRGALVALLALAALADARPDHDFEFDDTPVTAPRRPRRYIYDPHSEVCRALVCARREVCLLRDERTALCANRRDVLRRGDTIVSRSSAVREWNGADDEDVFYESGAAAGGGAARCVGCAGAARSSFLCGSDNRTYSSLCRLDLHNCVHRPRPPVRLACAGFCPCPQPERDERRPPRTHRARSPAERRRPDPSYNEVLPERAPPRRRTHTSHIKNAEGCAFDKMANRLLDWFSVLMEQAGGAAPGERGFGAECKPEVRWMFEHLDAGGDGVLQPGDLYALRHDERERCLRPFLRRCGAEAAGGVSRGAWCACLQGAARPCAALARAARGARARGGYVPACDARGFYRPRQCHAALAVCWCVDAHGQELPGTRTKGAPPCPGGDEDEEVLAPSDDEDEGAEGGSGEREPEPRF